MVLRQEETGLRPRGSSSGVASSSSSNSSSANDRIKASASLYQQHVKGEGRVRAREGGKGGRLIKATSSHNTLSPPLSQHQPPPPPPPAAQQAQHVLFNATKGENCQRLKRLFRRLRKAGVHVEMYVKTGGREGKEGREGRRRREGGEEGRQAR